MLLLLLCSFMINVYITYVPITPFLHSTIVMHTLVLSLSTDTELYFRTKIKEMSNRIWGSFIDPSASTQNTQLNIVQHDPHPVKHSTFYSYCSQYSLLYLGLLTLSLWDIISTSRRWRTQVILREQTLNMRTPCWRRTSSGAYCCCRVIHECVWGRHIDCWVLFSNTTFYCSFPTPSHPLTPSPLTTSPFSYTAFSTYQQS